MRQRNANSARSPYAPTNMHAAFRAYDREHRYFWMVVALSRGLPVRFKSARVVVVAGEERALVDMLVRMGIADLCCASEMATAQSLCDAGAVDACLVVLPRAVPDDRLDWDARIEAPGRGRIPSLLFAEAATPYVRRAAADAGYHAVIPLDGVLPDALSPHRRVASGRTPAGPWPEHQATCPRPGDRRHLRLRPGDLWAGQAQASVERPQIEPGRTARDNILPPPWCCRRFPTLPETRLTASSGL